MMTKVCYNRYIMSFILGNENVETADGQQAFITAYTYLRDRGLARDYLDGFSNNDLYTPWAEQNPTVSVEFLRRLAGAESSHARRLASSIALDWVSVDPDVVTEVLTEAMEDGDIAIVRTPTRELVSDMLNVSDYVHDLDYLGLARVCRLANTYEKTAEPQAPSV